MVYGMGRADDLLKEALEMLELAEAELGKRRPDYSKAARYVKRAIDLMDEAARLLGRRPRTA